MTSSDLKTHLTFNEWANARVFDAISGLTGEQLTKDLKSSFPSVLLTAGHIVGAEWAWLQRWLGNSPTVFPEWTQKPALGDLGARLRAVQAERAAFLAGLSDADVLLPRGFRLINGTEDEQSLDVMIKHVVNHSTYHRGQIATMLRQLGAKAPGTDFMLFAREALR